LVRGYSIEDALTSKLYLNGHLRRADKKL
jgi:hypothetical protein